MAKETVRYPDALVARIEAFVTDSSAFESKSEYHRFASEYLLSLLDPDHQPSVLGYGEIFDDLGSELDEVFDDSSPGEEPFLQTYIRARRHLLHGEVEAARAVVDEQYAVTDIEAVLLDELIGQSRGTDRRLASVEDPGQQGTERSDTPNAANGRVKERDSEASTASAVEEAEQQTSAPSAEETTVESEL